MDQRNPHHYQIKTASILLCIISLTTIDLHTTDAFQNLPFPLQRHLSRHSRCGCSLYAQKTVVKNFQRRKSSEKNSGPPQPSFSFPMIGSFTDQMPNTVEQLEDATEEADLVGNKNLSLNPKIAIGFAAILVGITCSPFGDSFLSNFPIITTFESLLSDPAATLQSVVTSIQSSGPIGVLYFGLFYTLAEILAIPATPLTASAGILFGWKLGTAVVLLSASIAASASFLLGRTFLRGTVETWIAEVPRFKKLDNAIAREGFKLVLLLRLSPLFPFALSNYFYGVTSVGFWEYFAGTLLGFTPGTLAYVAGGEIGGTWTLGTGNDGMMEWYVYVAGGLLVAGLLKVVADVANGIVTEIEQDGV